MKLDSDFKKRIKISAFSLALILIAEPFYRSALYDASISQIVSIQQNQGSTGFFTFYSTLCDVETYYVSIILCLAFSTKDRSTRAYQYMCLVTAIWTLKNFSKMLYQAPRPYMTAAEVRVVTSEACDQGFGSPSGHSTGAAAFAVYVALDLLGTDNRWRTVLGLCGAVAFFFFAGLSRFYLGLHAWNQIIFGWSLGVWLAFTFYFIVSPLIHYMMNSILSYLKEQLIVFAFVFGVQTLVFYLIDWFTTIDPAWLAMIQSKCGVSEINPYKTYHYTVFVNQGVCIMPLVAYYFDSEYGVAES